MSKNLGVFKVENCGNSRQINDVQNQLMMVNTWRWYGAQNGFRFEKYIFFGPGKYPKTDVETDWGHPFVTFFWGSWSLLWDLWPPLLTDGKQNSELHLIAGCSHLDYPHVCPCYLVCIHTYSIHIIYIIYIYIDNYIYNYIYMQISIYFLPVTFPLVCILFIMGNSDSVQEEKPSFGMAPPKAFCVHDTDATASVETTIGYGSKLKTWMTTDLSLCLVLSL